MISGCPQVKTVGSQKSLKLEKKENAILRMRILLQNVLAFA